MKSFEEYQYIYRKNGVDLSLGETRMLRLCCHWSISIHDPIKELRRVIQAAPHSTLNPFYEAVHLMAWCTKLKAEGNDQRIWQYRPGTSVHFPSALNQWWTRT